MCCYLGHFLELEKKLLEVWIIINFLSERNDYCGFFNYPYLLWTASFTIQILNGSMQRTLSNDASRTSFPCQLLVYDHQNMFLCLDVQESSVLQSLYWHASIDGFRKFYHTYVAIDNCNIPRLFIFPQSIQVYKHYRRNLSRPL